ncbi:MAG: beta-ketoacyl-[acyl-carrier-protein] synthase family protein [Propionibacteriaceae bacterium]|jgi:3-oxoacyl-[acyl-carrier-protein] synthase II|nr:beta-ketoacyl-[acyl-carrier-protein] synthase family protein [Propionibacteriaceae bacterium]
MRVVVTGYGLVTAVGADADQTWAALLQGQSGIAQNSLISAQGVTSSLAGQAWTEAEIDHPAPERGIRLGVKALAEAVGRAGLAEANPYPPAARALVLGTSMGGARKGDVFHRQWIEGGLGSADKTLLFEYPLHSTADAIAADFDLHGPRVVHSNACAAGSVAIGHAYEMLCDGQAEVVVAGGVDPLAHLAFAGFSSLGALTQLHCAPYTRSDGLNLGEGAGFLILEEYDRAVARGARIHAELIGFGLSADAYHPTAPDPRGKGALMAVNSALRLAGTDSSAVDYVNGHGTGTPANDSGELKTLLSLGQGQGQVPMSSTKSMIGHTLGAAGAVEAVVAVLSLDHQRLHPTYVPPDPAAREGLAKLQQAGRIDVIPDSARTTAVDLAISNSFAFGGNNACVVLARPGVAQPTAVTTARRSQSDLIVTGLAATAGSAVTTEAVRAACGSGDQLYRDRVELEDGSSFPVGLPDPRRLCEGVNPRILRRLDPLGRLAVHAFAQLLKQRRLTPAQLAGTGVIFATGIGPLSTVEAFQRGLIVNGQGDSRLFPNTVMNAAAGHVAVTFGLHGPTATVCAGGTSGISALHLASQLLRNRSCDRIAVIAADETPDCLLAGYSRYRGYLSSTELTPYGNTGVVYSSGSVALLLEASDEAVPDALPLARVLGIGMASDGSGSGGFSTDDEAWGRSFASAIGRAGLTPADLDLVVAAAYGRDRTDSIEQAALGRLGLRADVPVIAPRGVTGYLESASPLLGTLIATWLRQGDSLRLGVTPTAVARPEGQPLRALVSGFSIGGNFQSYVVEV